ncbi:MAG: cell division protein ZapA [Candidatus Cloacimonadaceae bacterium]|nr:cell division protein ZapA [Candidatus Cloacimonadaceae bacterium]MDP3114101.1 cell division protein ZapA [Candidatus Cloacimonadaceae bacterium]
MKSVEVDIFGRRFRLRSLDPDETLQIASEIDKQLNELKDLYEQLDFTKLLLLLALQQQEKVLNLGRKNQELSADLERMNQMIGRIIGE